MKHFSLRRLSQSFCLVIIILVTNGLVFGQISESLKPLTRDNLVDVCQRPDLKEHPDLILNDFVRRFKISFLPTKQQKAYLRSNKVPDLIISELKNNFACRLVYRVCKFEPVDGIGEEFTSILNSTLETERLITQAKSDSGILRDKIFEPVPSGPTGPSSQELAKFPNTGYLLIMGEIRNQPNSQNKTVIARLVFVSKVQERMSIASIEKTMANTLMSRKNIAKEIARWSIEELERQIE
jgi:hypothetical protein